MERAGFDTTLPQKEMFDGLRRVVFASAVSIVVACFAIAMALATSSELSGLVVAPLRNNLAATPYLDWVPDPRILTKYAVRFLYVLVPMIVAFGVEWIALGWKESSLRRVFFAPSLSDKYDAVYYALRLLSFTPLITLVCTLGLSYFGELFVAEMKKFAIVRHLRVETGVGIVDIFIYFMAVNFFTYWVHRLLHWGPFWHLHRMHHSATTLSPFTGERTHPAHLLVTSVGRSFGPAFFGAPVDFIFLLRAVVITHNFVVHSNLSSDWGWVGRWIINSPGGHRAHHSPLPELHNKNFGIFMIWDRIFGSYVPGIPLSAPVGLPGPIHNTGNLPKEWLMDLRAFGRGCWPRKIAGKLDPRIQLAASGPRGMA